MGKLSRFLGISFLFISSISSAQITPIKSIQEYWDETGLQFSDVDSNFKNKGCSKTYTAFVGCVFAIKALLNEFEQPLDFVYRPGADAKILDAFGDYAIVEIANRRNETIDVQLTRKKKDIATWASLYSIHKISSALDFEKVFDSLLKVLLNSQGKSYEAYYAATASNAYIEVALDAHAYLVPEEKAEAKTNGARHSFVGVGVTLSAHKNGAMVQNLDDEGPALSAGIRQGDVITGIEGEPTENIPTNQIVGKLMGENGSVVKVQIRRRDTLMEIAIKRAPVTVDNIRRHLIVDRNKVLGYLRVDTFNDTDTFAEKVRDAVKFFIAQKANGIILDLRSNFGGGLIQAQKLASLFLPKNSKIVEIKPLLPFLPEDTFIAEEKQLTTLPLVVMINGFSASSSEIVAGALQDLDRAIIVGEQSFGKGSVQMPFALPFTVKNPKKKIRFYRTVARFFSPGNRTIQQLGIQPDIQLELPPELASTGFDFSREKDFYPTALPPIPNNWVPRRPALFQQLNECRRTPALSKYKQRFEELQARGLQADYELLQTQDLFQCIQGP